MTEAVWLSWLVNGVLGLAMFMMKRGLDAADKKYEDLRTDFRNMSVEVNGVKQNYLHKEDFREFKLELRGMFEELKSSIRNLGKHNHEQ